MTASPLDLAGYVHAPIICHTTSPDTHTILRRFVDRVPHDL